MNASAALGFLGYAYLQSGDFPAAISALERALDQLAPTGFAQLLGWFSAFLAEAYLSSGRLDDARLRAEAGLAFTRDTRFWYGAGLAQRALGRVARQAGRDDLADAHLSEALTTFTTVLVPFEAAKTHLDLAELATAQGDPARASHHLARAHDLFAGLELPSDFEHPGAPGPLPVVAATKSA